MTGWKPWGETNHPEIKGADICVMGVPFDGAVCGRKGAAQGPEVMRFISRHLPSATEEGLLFTGLKIYDHGDIDLDLDWQRYYAAVEEQAYELFSSGAFCLFLGGDHSVTIPLHRAFAHYYQGRKIGVVHFDSHMDMNNEFDGHKWSHACTERRAVESIIDPADLALVGIRSWEPDEIEYFDANPEVMLITAREIYLGGWRETCEKLKERFSQYDAVYLTFDIDVLDPSIAPGTGTPEPGGISVREAMEMMRLLVSEIPVKAMDMVEVSPPLDSANNITSLAALKIIYEAFGVLHQRRSHKLST